MMMKETTIEVTVDVKVKVWVMRPAELTD